MFVCLFGFFYAQFHGSQKGREKIIGYLSNYMTKSMYKIEKFSTSFLKHKFVQLHCTHSKSLSLSRLHLNYPSGKDCSVELRKELKNGNSSCTRQAQKLFYLKIKE